MTTQPLFFLLNQHMGWHNDSANQVSIGSELALTGRPDGPLGLNNPDGSLGHLTLPRGVALADDGTVLLIPANDHTQVLRYDVEENAFVSMPGVGEAGKDARNFDSARNLAIAGNDGGQLLYVADTGNYRVQVFHLASLALLHMFSLPHWRPVDVAAWGDWAYILDGEKQRVYRHNVSGERLELVCESTFPARWRRIALDRAGRIYLLNKYDPENLRLDVFTPEQPRGVDGNPSSDPWEHFTDAGDVYDRFDTPAVIVQSDPRQGSPYHGGIFQLNAQGCEAEKSASSNRSTYWFDRNGQSIEFKPDGFLEPRAYHSQGEWISLALDSQIYRCQWHRVELLMTAFPAGTRLLISTYSNADPTLPIQPLWQKSYEAVGTSGQDSNTSTDFLIQSRPGQYLWLKIEIFGDGYGTPRVDGMRVHFPRESYLAHLPAVYSEENSRWFLERFLSIFQTEWDELEKRINRSAALFDPAAVADQDGSLENLAGWLALPLEGEWNEEKKRRLLQAVSKYYPRRGTQEGLRTFVQVYLQNMTSLSPELQSSFPVFIEGFRRRNVESFLLNRLEEDNQDPQDTSTKLLGSAPSQQTQSVGRVLWGPGKVSRLQLNRYSRAGEARLVSTGDSQLDLFHEYAHRFQVYIPSAWIGTADDERRLRRALDAEKPAQTVFELCLVEPRFRVGIQSTIGVDTILGAIPTVSLASASTEVNEVLPPSQAPRGRLGYDTVLTSPPGALPTVPFQAGGSQRLP